MEWTNKAKGCLSPFEFSVLYVSLKSALQCELSGF